MDRSVRTVLGDISSDELGITMTHEHCLVDLRSWFVTPTEASRAGDLDRPIEMSMLGELRRRQMSTTRTNLILSDEELAIDELKHYQRLGGQSLVELSCIGIGRDPIGLQRISRATGLNVVMGTGLYVENAHPSNVKEMGIDDLAEMLVRDIDEGVGHNHVKAGIIGEVGVSGIEKGAGRVKVGPVTPEEEKSLRASARAANATGVAVSVHLDAFPPLGAQPALDILFDEGLPPERIIIGHLDQVNDVDYTLAVAERGAYVQFDAVGREYYREEWGYGLVMGQDIWRADFVRQVVEAGHGHRLLFAQDVCFKSDLKTFGGYGYAHILRSIVPLLEAKGVSRDQIQRILVENPARAIAIEPAMAPSA